MTEPHRPEQDAEPTPSISPISPPSSPSGQASEQLASEKLASEKLASEKLASEKLASEKLASEKLASEKLASEKQDPPTDPPPEAAQDEVIQDPAPEANTDLPDQEPEPLAQDFPSLGLPAPLLTAIEKLGWQKPSPVQAKSFSPFFAGRDVLVQSHTGSGKTGAFCLPWIAKQCNEADEAKKGTVRFLAVVPTRELAKQVAREFGNLADGQPLKVESFYGGTAIVPQLSALEQGVDVVIGTPGRLLDHLRRKSLDLSKLETVVLDECDEMLSMGFLEDIRAILEHCPKDRQTGLFSATLPPDIVRITRRYLDDPVHVELSGDQVAAREIDHVYYQITSGVKTRDLLDVLMVEDPPTGIIFCNTREETRMVSSVLQREGYAAQAISSDLTQSAREEVLASMREHKLRFLVATDVAARGIDISHITHVINYSFPNVAESYVHRTGRTGRAGKSGVAISLISPLEIGDFYLLKKQYADLNITERDLPDKQTLADQRRELKIDRISRDLSKPVSPEWVALARDLQKDPRGERIIAYLLNQAHKEAQRPRAEARALKDDEAGSERDDRGFRSRGRGRDRDRDSEGRRSRGRDGERSARRGRRRGSEEELESSSESQVQDPDVQATEGSDDAGRTPRRERVARARRDGSFRNRRSGSRGRGRAVEDAEPGEELQDSELPGDDASSEGEREPTRNRRRRRRGRAEGDDLAATETETESEESEAQEDAESGRRRKRRRRRRGKGSDAQSADPSVAADEDAEFGEDKDEEAPTGRNQRRRRRSRNRGASGAKPEPMEARVDQDKIIIDIDEEELEVVRDAFGEINELDDLTVKGRRRGFLDEIESGDDVILEDLSKVDQDRSDAEAQDDEDEDELDEGASEETDASQQDDENAETSGGEATEDDDAAPRKKRRRRRRKKRQPPPMPELTAPPHKDFWEVWSEKFSASDFSELEKEDQAELEAQAEQKAQARAKRAQERKEAAAARKEAQRAKAQARAEARSEQQAQSDAPAAPAALHEEEPSDLVRISLNVGRSQGCKSAAIRKLLEERCGLGRRSVKDLTVRTASTLLAVDQSQASAVKAALDGHTLEETVLEVTLLDADKVAPDDDHVAKPTQASPEADAEAKAEADAEAKAEAEADEPPKELSAADEADSEDLQAAAPAKASRAKKKTTKRSTKKKSSKKKATKKKSSKKKATKKKSSKKKTTKKTSKRAAKKSAAKKE